MLLKKQMHNTSKLVKLLVKVLVILIMFAVNSMWSIASILDEITSFFCSSFLLGGCILFQGTLE